MYGRYASILPPDQIIELRIRVRKRGDLHRSSCEPEQGLGLRATNVAAQEGTEIHVGPPATDRPLRW